MFDTISKVATTGISQKTSESNPRIPESLELFPGLVVLKGISISSNTFKMDVARV